MSAADTPALHADHADIFDTGGTNGMARVAMDALPVVRFTERSNVDASGELIACSVCLQVLYCLAAAAATSTRALLMTISIFASAGIPSRRQREEPAGVPPHVPPAVHRRLAAPARLLPLVPPRCLGRARSSTLKDSRHQSCSDKRHPFLQAVAVRTLAA